MKKWDKNSNFKLEWPIVDTDELSTGYRWVSVTINSSNKNLCNILLVAGHIGISYSNDDTTIQPVTGYAIVLTCEKSEESD